MPNDPLFPGQYRGSGQVALLCEGDAIGYEASLLGRWTREVEPGGRQVDVLACGTGGGLFAMADAIGRLVRVVVIEDRDYRSLDVAEEECRAKLADRERRGVAMRGWATWQRSEIENYFLEEAELLPVMAEMFGCSESDVSSALDTAIGVLGPYQALAATRSQARHVWIKTDPAERLSASARPKWTPDRLKQPDPGVVRTEFEKALRVWQSCCSTPEPFGELIEGTRLLTQLETRLREWTGMSRSSSVWRIDWGGKEVLKSVRQRLAARAAGWWSVEAGKPVAWERLGGRAKQDDHDRRIERQVQPALVTRLFQQVMTDSAAPMRAELDRLDSLLRS